MAKENLIHICIKYRKMKDAEQQARELSKRVHSLLNTLSIEDEALFYKIRDDFPWNLKLELVKDE